MENAIHNNLVGPEAETISTGILSGLLAEFNSTGLLLALLPVTPPASFEEFILLCLTSENYPNI